MEIETTYIELIITLVIYLVAYFSVVMIFKIVEHQFEYIAIFTLFIIVMLEAFEYHLYVSFAVIVLIDSLILYAKLKGNDGGINEDN